MELKQTLQQKKPSDGKIVRLKQKFRGMLSKLESLAVSIIDSILTDPEIKHCGESGSVISIDSGVRTQGMESTGGCSVINMLQPVNLSIDPNVVARSFDLLCTGKQVSSGGYPLRFF